MVAVSVIVPVYNPAQYLIKCLDSLCSQTLRDIEIICVNDCSTDNSLSILQEYAKRDKRIKIIDLKENQGAAVARNIAIKNACGQYLGFVDSDDFIDHNFYEKLYEKALKTDANVVKGNIVVLCSESKSVINDNVQQNKSDLYFNFTSAIYKTSFIKENKIEFLEGLVYFEDTYFTIKAALFYKKLESVGYVSYYYVNNQNSVTHKNHNLNVESLIDGVHKVLDLLDNHCFDKEHYMVVFSFLLEHILYFCYKINVSDEVNIKAVNSLLPVYNRCRYKTEFMEYYFLQKKKIGKEELIRKLRNKVKNV
jgi:glycosyltransferase involved in cell wall biosynthesis